MGDESLSVAKSKESSAEANKEIAERAAVSIHRRLHGDGWRHAKGPWVRDITNSSVSRCESRHVKRTSSLLSSMANLTHQSSRYFSSLALNSRNLPLLANRDLPPFFHRDSTHHYPTGSPKGKRPLRDGVEEEVSDREWELRVGQYPETRVDDI